MPHFDVAVGLVYRRDNELLIQRRAEEGLLGGLWEFPGGKREPGEALASTCVRELREELGIDVAVEGLVQSIRHAYSHFRITLYAYRCRLVAGEPVSRTGLPVQWAPIERLGEFAFPRANRRLIEHLTGRSD